MPKALIFNVPGHGHVNPSLPLVAELVRRGHHITYFITDKYRERVEAAGAEFRPYAAVHDDYFDARGLSGKYPQKVARQLMITAGEILPELLHAVEQAKPDYILFDGMCAWGQMVAWITKLPGVASLALAPPVRPPPSAMLNLQMLRLVLPLVFRDFGAGIEASRLSREMAKRYNIPVFAPTRILSSEGDLAISYTSSYFQSYASTVPKTVRFVGWTVNETPADGSFSLDEAKGRRVIYVSLGTMNNDDRDFFKGCIEAFSGTEYYVLMSTGSRINPDSFGTLPENISIRGWVPQIGVLKQAALFITHGGMNSIHDGLYFGVPLLLVPQQEEQTLNALRVMELGAGLILKKQQINGSTIRAESLRLLTESRFKDESRRIGDSLRAAVGMTYAGDEIEGLLRSRGIKISQVSQPMAQ